MLTPRSCVGIRCLRPLRLPIEAGSPYRAEYRGHRYRGWSPCRAEYRRCRHSWKLSWIGVYSTWSKGFRAYIYRLLTTVEPVYIATHVTSVQQVDSVWCVSRPSWGFALHWIFVWQDVSGAQDISTEEYHVLERLRPWVAGLCRLCMALLCSREGIWSDEGALGLLGRLGLELRPESVQVALPVRSESCSTFKLFVLVAEGYTRGRK